MRRMLVFMVVVLSLPMMLACSPATTSLPSFSQQSNSILSGTIAVGVTNDSPGFANGGETGNPAGFDIQVMKALDDERSKRKTSPSILTVANRAASLKDHSVELVIATYSITSSRNAEGIDFAGPYMATPQALLVRAKENDIQSKSDLADKVVCSVENTTGRPVKIPGANMDHPSSTTAGCVKQLKDKNAHAVFDDELILHGFTNAYPGQFKVILPGVVGTGQLYGIAMLGGRRNDCLEINKIIRNYLRTQWTTDFRATLPDAVKAYPKDFETRFKPADSHIERVSCQLK